MTAPGGGGPLVELEFETLWCGRHWAPFAVPTGLPAGARASVELITRAASMPAVQDAAKLDAAKLGAAMRRFAPVCCFVSAPDLAAVYAAAGVRPPAGPPPRFEGP